MYRVFLGSTGRDLQAYRDAIRDVIHRLDGFEHSRSVDRGTRKKVTAKTDRTKLRQSDLFIGLVGHALTDKAPGEADSLAEREYDLAVETDRPRLIFCAPDDFAGPANLRQSDEAFARQEAFRGRTESVCTAATVQRAPSSSRARSRRR